MAGFVQREKGLNKKSSTSLLQVFAEYPCREGIFINSILVTDVKSLNIKAGDEISIASKSQLFLRYINEASFLDIKENSSLSFSCHNNNHGIFLTRGEMLLDIEKKSSFESIYINTPHVTLLASTAFIRIVCNSKTLVAVEKGTVRAYSVSSGRLSYIHTDQSTVFL